MIKWGFYSRKLRLGELVDGVEPFPVRRWRCKPCIRTFSYLPPFVLVLKRYAAAIIQGVWESRVLVVAGSILSSLERLAESWGLPCVVTLRRWLAPLDAHGAAIEAELRRVLAADAEVGFEHQPARRILSLVQLYTRRLSSLHPLDQARVPYHHVSHLLRRLHACNG